MSTLDQEYAAWTSGAMIFITFKDNTSLIRPAAFVWALPDGIEWVEPSYADPYGASSPSYHERRGRFLDRYTVTTDYGDVEALPFDPATDMSFRDSAALVEFRRYIDDNGLDFTAERNRLHALIHPAE